MSKFLHFKFEVDDNVTAGLFARNLHRPFHPQDYILSYAQEYPKAGVTTDIVVFHQLGTDEEALLLIKRKNDPFAGHLALPGGFLNMDELIRDCAARELQEETSLQVNSKDLVYVGYYDQVDRDKRSRVISHCFAINLKHRPPVKAMDDAAEVGWFSSWVWPLAFDHNKMVEDAKEKLNVQA
jgi:8-oxo-dGTP diphosphatase